MWRGAGSPVADNLRPTYSLFGKARSWSAAGLLLCISPTTKHNHPNNSYSHHPQRYTKPPRSHCSNIQPPTFCSVSIPWPHENDPRHFSASHRRRPQGCSRYATPDYTTPPPISPHLVRTPFPRRCADTRPGALFLVTTTAPHFIHTAHPSLHRCNSRTSCRKSIV